jgi:hypothetical protein
MVLIAFRWTDKVVMFLATGSQDTEYGKKRIVGQLIIGNSATYLLLFTCDIFHASQGTKPPVSKLLLLLLLVLSAILVRLLTLRDLFVAAKPPCFIF